MPAAWRIDALQVHLLECPCSVAYLLQSYIRLLLQTCAIISPLWQCTLLQSYCTLSDGCLPD